MIIDRGHGDACSLTRAGTLFARLPWVSDMIQRDYHCGGINKIAGLPGQVMYLTTEKPGDDQMMSWGGVNQTSRLHDQKDGQVHHMKGADHWSNWGQDEYNATARFLTGVLRRNVTLVRKDTKPRPKPSFAARHLLPIGTKSWIPSRLDPWITYRTVFATAIAALSGLVYRMRRS